MIGVDVGCNLEDETCELRLSRFYQSLFCLGGTWTWCNLYEAIQQFLHSKVVQSRTKENNLANHGYYMGSEEK